jgi:16S rRNA (guanine527-N7)-methyltransferase
MLEQLLKLQLPAPYRHLAPEFTQFLNLLERWNQAYNLTAIRQPEEMIPLHILDCLAILPYIKGPRLLDVGSGAGFPGIPIAICHKNLSITLVESSRKRVQFLETVKHALNLKHVTIWNGRIEHYSPETGFDTITSRAFSNLTQFVELTRNLCTKNGQWCAMKGQIPYEELKELGVSYQIYPYEIPGQNVARCCIVINQKD